MQCVYICCSNLTIYSLVEELLSSSQYSQVHNWLVPSLAKTRLLLRHTADTHVLLQAVQFVLADFLKSSDIFAPAKLTALLTFVPINTCNKYMIFKSNYITLIGIDTWFMLLFEGGDQYLFVTCLCCILLSVLPTTSLQLYLSSCRKLAQRTALFLPRADQEQQLDSDEETEDVPDEDADDDEDMEVDDLAHVEAALGAMQKPPDNIIEVCHAS